MENEAEIEEIIEGFVEAARRAKESGFDGIELFAAYNAIIDQFWLPFNNRRDDKWGGSLENRMRFSRSIMERIRKMAGDDFIIGLAVNMDSTVNMYPGIRRKNDRNEHSTASLISV